MLKFEPFSIELLKKVLPYLRENPYPCSDFSAGALFMWQEGTELAFCEWNDTLIIKQNRGEQAAFSLPFGKDPDGMLDELLKYVRENRLALRLLAPDEKALGQIKRDSRLKAPVWACDTRWSDYIYSFEEAKTFRGKKYSGQRNHINRFKRLYGEPDIRFLTAEDLPDVLKMLSEYEAEHPAVNRLEEMELENTKRLLSVYESLGLYAAGLFVDGHIAAFSIGETVGDMLLIHIEKALRKYDGVYPVMYSGFVRLMDGHSLQTVNREDDSGDPGIRTSKMQYHPVKQIHKYLVNIDSPAARIENLPDIESGDIVLTAFRETDKKAYREINTDVENNRFWGYDYREDAWITGEIDDDTFYDSVQFDMQAGDSINFAVRLTADGEMIGEAILWNFTSRGDVEIGCRIMPRYSRKGYGTAAFRAAADFAEKELGLKVHARCFKENIPSRRMIAAGGFEPWYSTESHDYFRRKSPETT